MTIEVELKYPIKAHGEEVTSLSLRRIRMADLIKMDSAAGEMGKMAKLIECVAEIPASSVAQIDAEDLAKIAEAIGPFLQAFQQTGESAQ